MKTILPETTTEVVGLSSKKHQDWFDKANKEIQVLLEKKRSCHNYLLAKPDDQSAKAAYKTACSTLQAMLRTMQNDWWTGLACFGHRHKFGTEYRSEDVNPIMAVSYNSVGSV